jgi:hypothetical protein
MRPNSTGWVASTVQRIFGPTEVITIFGGDRSDAPKPLSVQEKLHLARVFVEDYQARITGSIDALQISVSSPYANTAAFADLCEKLGANHLPIDLGARGAPEYGQEYAEEQQSHSGLPRRILVPVK